MGGYRTALSAPCKQEEAPNIIGNSYNVVRFQVIVELELLAVDGVANQKQSYVRNRIAPYTVLCTLCETSPNSLIDARYK